MGRASRHLGVDLKRQDFTKTGNRPKILFVSDGEGTVRFGDLNTMIKKDEALLISKGQAHLIAAGPDSWAKILRLDVPPRQVVTPQILTIDR